MASKSWDESQVVAIGDGDVGRKILIRDDQYGELAEFLRHQQGEASARGCVLCRLECLLAAMRTTTDTTADSSCAQGEP